MKKYVIGVGAFNVIVMGFTAIDITLSSNISHAMPHFSAVFAWAGWIAFGVALPKK